MYSTVRFKCNESDCKALDELIKYNYSFLLNFKSPKKSTDPLILLSIKCSDKTEKNIGNHVLNKKEFMFIFITGNYC